MDENNTAVTADADTKVVNAEDRFEVETNIAPEPEKAEAAKVEPKTEPDDEEPQESKSINPRTMARRAEKERLIRDNAAMSRDNAALAARLEKLEAKDKPSDTATPKKRDSSVEPSIQDYEDAIDFMDAKLEHKLFKQEEARELKLQTASQNKQLAALTERAEVYRSDKPDFDEKVGALIESRLLTPDIEQAVLQSDMSEKLTYHLAQYGSDLMALRGTPIELLPKAIKAIESFIAKGGQEQETPRTTRAQPPISPPGNTAKTDRSLGSYTQEEIEDMPQAEFNRRFGK